MADTDNKKEEKTLFFGHRNPDTDSVISAIILAGELGGTPCYQDQLNEETKFVLDYCEVDHPQKIDKVAGRTVFLVDFNGQSQAPDDILQAELEGIVDHHNLASDVVPSANPVTVIMEPVGCTCTILSEKFFDMGIIDAKEAKMMLCAILSDTLAFRSPTTTESDVKAADVLAQKAGVGDAEGLAKLIFKAKSNLAGKTIAEIIDLDYKVFEMGQRKVGIALVETIEPEKIVAKQADFVAYLEKKREEDKLDYLIFCVVDIWEQNCIFLMPTELEKSLVSTVFGKSEVIEDNFYKVDGIVSRKKQIVPPIKDYLS